MNFWHLRPLTLLKRPRLLAKMSPPPSRDERSRFLLSTSTASAVHTHDIYSFAMSLQRCSLCGSQKYSIVWTLPPPTNSSKMALIHNQKAQRTTSKSDQGSPGGRVQDHLFWGWFAQFPSWPHSQTTRQSWDSEKTRSDKHNQTQRQRFQLQPAAHRHRDTNTATTPSTETDIVCTVQSRTVQYIVQYSLAIVSDSDGDSHRVRVVALIESFESFAV